jgi:hypothetical protein
MINHSIEKEYQGIVNAYEKAGGDRNALLGKGTAKLVIHENRVNSSGYTRYQRSKWKKIAFPQREDKSW